jgi:hypothetical protein
MADSCARLAGELRPCCRPLALQVLKMLQQKQQLLAGGGAEAGGAEAGSGAAAGVEVLEEAQDDGTGTTVAAGAPLHEKLRAQEMRGLLEAVLQP